MSPLAIVVLAFSMSIDSHLAAIGWGAGRRRLQIVEVVATGILFALVQMATPLIGWSVGSVASSFIAPIDHWIAFLMLGFVGGRMAWLAWRGGDDEEAPASAGSSMGALLLTAIGTSIDAMAVGVSLAFLKVDILVVTLAIGGATFVMAAGGLLMGQAIKCRFGRCAEMLAGGVLVALGCFILFEHLWG